MSDLSISAMLDRLTKLIDYDDSELVEEFVKEMQLYFDESIRLDYSEIVKFINDDKVELDIIETIEYNLGSVIEYLRNDCKICDCKNIDDNCYLKCSTMKGLYKVRDHVRIEQQRKIVYSEFIYNLKSQTEKVDELARGITSATERQEEIAYTVSSFESRTISTTVSVLGIFSAAVLGFFANLQILSGVITASQNLRIYKLTFLISLCGMVLYNVLFLLLYSISKISNNGIGVANVESYEYYKVRRLNKPSTWIRFSGIPYYEVPAQYPSEPPDYEYRRTNLLKRAFIRYPHLVWVNIVFVFIAGLACFFWVASTVWGWNWLP